MAMNFVTANRPQEANLSQALRDQTAAEQAIHQGEVAEDQALLSAAGGLASQVPAGAWGALGSSLTGGAGAGAGAAGAGAAGAGAAGAGAGAAGGGAMSALGALGPMGWMALAALAATQM